MPLNRERFGGRPQERRQSLRCICISLFRSLSTMLELDQLQNINTDLLIPPNSHINILRSSYSHLSIKAHCKLSIWQTLFSSLLRKRKCQTLIFVKAVPASTQEPFTQRHISLDPPLLTCQRIIVHAEQRIKWEW